MSDQNSSNGKCFRPATIADLERRLRQGRDFDVVIVREVAQAILESWNTGNRRIDQTRVRVLARDQSEGRFLDGEVIGFGVLPEVQLGDGQHRLSAQVVSDTEQVYRARVFTDEEAFKVFVLSRDSGKVRSLADLLGIFNMANGAGASQAFERVTNAMQTFYGSKPRSLSQQERMDFALKHAKEIRYVLSLPTRKFRPHMLAAIAIAHRKHAAAVEDFVSKVLNPVAEGAKPSADSPAWVLHEAINDLNAARGDRDRDRAVAATLRAIHDGISGKRKTSITRIMSSSPNVIAAITDFAGAQAASAWLARYGRGADK